MPTQAENELRTALRASKAIETAADTTSPAIARMVDLRIPLWSIAGSTVTLIWALISMYFSLQQLTRDVAELQATLKAGNSAAVAAAGEIALMRYRVENIEAELARIRSQSAVVPRK